MRHLWPVLLLGIAVGLYEYSLYASVRTRGLTTAAVILGLLSLVLVIFTLLGTGALYLLGAVLVAAGLWLMLGRGRPGSRKKWNGGW